jgi:hypothetical protein
MRRFRLAGHLGLATTAVAFGLSLLSVAPPAVSAMPCGPIRDRSGNIVNWVDCNVELTTDVPGPCVCPDSMVRFRKEDLSQVEINQAGVSQQLAGSQMTLAR